MSERPGAGPTTGTGNEKQRTLGNLSSPVFSHFIVCSSHTLLSYSNADASKETTSGLKKRKNSKIIAVFFTFCCGRRTKTFQYGFEIKLGISFREDYSIKQKF